MNAVLNYSIQLANERAVWDVRQFVSMTRPGINDKDVFTHPSRTRPPTHTNDRRTRRETRLVTRSFELA